MKKLVPFLAVVLSVLLLFGIASSFAEESIGISTTFDSLYSTELAGDGSISSDTGTSSTSSSKKEDRVKKNIKVDFELNDDNIFLAYILNGQDFDQEESLEHEGEEGYGKLKFILRDLDNKGVPNVQFIIRSDTGLGNSTTVGSIRTNDRGVAYTMLPAGNYYISQPQNLPAGYAWHSQAKSGKWITFTIRSKQVTRIKETCLSTSFGRVKVRATDQYGDAVEGAVFTIYKNSDSYSASSGGNSPVATLTSSAKGSASANLAPGNYIIKVKNVPAGYNVTGVYALSGSSPITHAVPNSSTDKQKVDSGIIDFFSGSLDSLDNGWLGASASSGIGSAATASAGNTGYFTVSSKKSSSVDVEFNRDNSDFGTLQITLTDQDGNGVSHGVYTILINNPTDLDGDGKQEDFIAYSVATDDNGISMTALPAGSYVIYERNADLPEGYKPGSKVYANTPGGPQGYYVPRSTPFEITSRKITNLHLKCVYEKTGRLVVHLTDQYDNKVPSGSYGIYKWESSSYGHLGEVLVDTVNIKDGYGSIALEEGDYQIYEEGAVLPAKYHPGVWNDGMISVSRSTPVRITADKSTIISLHCYKDDTSTHTDDDGELDPAAENEGRVHIICLDQDGNKVAGASYTIYKWQSSVYGLLSEVPVATITTNRNGFASSGLLPAGTYQVHDTGRGVTLPSGYTGGEKDEHGFITVGDKQFQIKNGDVTTLTMHCCNENREGNVRIKLLDETDHGVSGATFYICQWVGSEYGLLNRQVVATAMTNSEGIAYVSLPAGTYDLAEPTLPGRYRYGTSMGKGVWSSSDGKQFQVNPGKSVLITTHCFYDLGSKTLDDFTAVNVYLTGKETYTIDKPASENSQINGNEYVTFAGENLLTIAAPDVYGTLVVLDKIPEDQVEAAGFKWMTVNDIPAYWKKTENGYVYANIIAPKYFLLRNSNGSVRTEQAFSLTSLYSPVKSH